MGPWGCDTFVAMPDASVAGHTLMGKNSDRVAFESQLLRFFPRRRAERRLSLAYIEVPGARESYAHVGSSPYWCWGHELGLNEWGVAIGNEAQFTRDLAASITALQVDDGPREGIVGMELLRLGLERGRTAQEALGVMADLLEQYGQWGSAVPGQGAHEGAYDNSYLIADPGQAWVLETSGARWVAKQIRSGTYSVSNHPTIRTEWDRASEDLVDFAVNSGYWPQKLTRPFDFARAYTDPETPLQVSQIRLQRSRQMLRDGAAEGGIHLGTAKRILRDHYEDTFLGGPYFSAALPDFQTLCMHDHPAGFTWGNTTASAVFVLPEATRGFAHMWWTPGPPCVGVYLPVFVAARAVPAALTLAGSAGERAVRPDRAVRDASDPRSYWWRFQKLLDAAKGGELAWAFEERQPLVREALDELEHRWLEELPLVEEKGLSMARQGEDPAPLLAEFTRRCADEATHALDRLMKEIGTADL